MKDLETVELDNPNSDVAFVRVSDRLEDKRFDISEIRLVDTFMRYNIKDNTRTYYYTFEVRY
jgi:hypothetical protein